MWAGRRMKSLNQCSEHVSNKNKADTQTGAYRETRSRRANTNPNTGNLWVQKEQPRDRLQKNKQVGNERIRQTEVLESRKAAFMSDLAEDTCHYICWPADYTNGRKVSRRGGVDQVTAEGGVQEGGGSGLAWGWWVWEVSEASSARHHKVQIITTWEQLIGKHRKHIEALVDMQSGKSNQHTQLVHIQIQMDCLIPHIYPLVTWPGEHLSIKHHQTTG